MQERRKDETPEILPASEPPRPRHELMTVAEGLTLIDRRMEVMDALRQRALSGLTSKGWNRWPGSKYRLTKAGADFVARQCAISHSELVRSYVTDRQGEPCGIQLEADFTLPGGYDRVHAIGTCEYSDGFVWSPNKRVIREADGFKKAYANLVVNGIMNLLGIGIVDDEMLKSFGLDPKSVDDVDVEKNKRGGDRTDIPDELKPKYQEAAQILGELASGDAGRAAEILLSATAWPEKNFKGWDRIAKVSPKAIGPTLGKLKKLREELAEKDDREMEEGLGGLPPY